MKIGTVNAGVFGGAGDIAFEAQQEIFDIASFDLASCPVHDFFAQAVHVGPG